MTASQIQKAGTAAVRRLRDEKLRNGRPFMINASSLPDNQAYLEYPDGKMQLVSVAKGARDFTVIRELSAKEIEVIYKTYLHA